MRLAVIAALVCAPTLARADDDHAADLAAISAALPACDTARAHCVGLRLHVVADEHGVVATPAWTAAELAAVNHHFAPLDVGFEVTAVDGLPATAVHVVTRADRNAFARGADGKGVIDVFVVGAMDDIDTPGAIIHGVTWRPPKHTYIILVSSAMERTLAHELGHVFGLPHSTYAISIMNKTPRDDPPMEQRTFADEELAIMKPNLAHMLKTHALIDRR